MPTGAQRKVRNDGVKKTNPVKGKKTKTASSSKKSSNDSGRGELLSDKLARQVARGKMSHSQAMTKQKAQDKRATRSKVSTTTRTSSDNLPSKREWRKPKYRINNKGEREAY